MLQLARTEIASKAPPLRLKKLYLLAALEVDQLKAKMLNIGEHSTAAPPSKAGAGATGTAAAAHTLAGKEASVYKKNTFVHIRNLLISFVCVGTSFPYSEGS